MRMLPALAAICLIASPVTAADSKVASAAKVFQSVAADPQKMKTFCEMTKAMDGAGDKEDPATDAKIQGYITLLGPDFETAWNAGADVDENSEDGKVYNAALETLTSKCA